MYNEREEKRETSLVEIIQKQISGHTFRTVSEEVFASY